MTEGDEQGFGDTGGDTEMPPRGAARGRRSSAARGRLWGQRLWGRVACPHGVPRSRGGVPRARGAFGVLAGPLWSPQLLLQVWERRKGPQSCSLCFIPSPCAPPPVPGGLSKSPSPSPLSLPGTPQGHKP